MVLTHKLYIYISIKNLAKTIEKKLDQRLVFKESNMRCSSNHTINTSFLNDNKDPILPWNFIIDINSLNLINGELIHNIINHPIIIKQLPII